MRCSTSSSSARVRPSSSSCGTPPCELRARRTSVAATTHLLRLLLGLARQLLQPRYHLGLLLWACFRRTLAVHRGAGLALHCVHLHATGVSTVARESSALAKAVRQWLRGCVVQASSCAAAVERNGLAKGGARSMEATQWDSASMDSAAASRHGSAQCCVPTSSGSCLATGCCWRARADGSHFGCVHGDAAEQGLVSVDRILVRARADAIRLAVPGPKSTSAGRTVSCC